MVDAPSIFPVFNAMVTVLPELSFLFKISFWPAAENVNVADTLPPLASINPMYWYTLAFERLYPPELVIGLPGFNFCALSAYAVVATVVLEVPALCVVAVVPPGNADAAERLAADPVVF